MASQSLLNIQIELGKNTLRACDAQGSNVIDIEAAFWALDEDTESWRFTMVESSLDRVGTKKVYEQLVPILDRATAVLKVREIYLLPPTDRLVNLVRQAVTTGGMDIADILFTGNVIRGISLPDMYIYRMSPPHLAVSAL